MINELAPGPHALTVDGVRQVYHVAGHGPVCVAHPGGPGLHWSYLRSAALEARFTMVYLEPVGTGDSGRLAARDDYHLDTYVRFLDAVLTHLGGEPVHLLGHSHGGFVVLRHALAHPGRAAGLILYSTAPVAGPELWGPAMAEVAAYPGRHPDEPEAASVPAGFQQAGAAGDDEAITAAFGDVLPVYFADFWSRRAELAPFRAAVRMSIAPAGGQEPVPFDVRARLGEITVPVVVIAGRHDFLCGPSWGAPLAAGIPGAHLRVLERSGHFAHVEQPVEFAGAAAELLPR